MDTITRTDLQLQLWDSDLRAYVPVSPRVNAMIPSDHEIANLALERQLHDARNDLLALRRRLALTKKELETIVAAIDKALKS